MPEMPSSPQVTQWLAAHRAGDRTALDRLVPYVYEQLRCVARARLCGERADHTLRTTDLVHEAYLRLAELDRMPFENRIHLLAVASTMMRRILVNYALRRRAAKRGGGAALLPLDEERLVPDAQAEALLELHEALERLAEVHPRPADVVQHHYFGGLTNPETAAVMGLSVATVERDLRFARAWLAREWTTQAAH